MRNLALVWVLAGACLLAVGVGDAVATVANFDNLKKKVTIAGGVRNYDIIFRGVFTNIGTLRKAYDKRVRKNPSLDGTVTVKFAIDEFGAVISTQVVESTANDTTFENTLVKMINGWVFEEIDKPGDTTVAVFPFHFSQ